MKRQVIDNLLQQPDTPKRFCRVVAPIGVGRYQVLDASGRIVDVDGSAQWSPGDGVVIAGGRIVGRAARFKQPTVYFCD